MNVAGFIDPEPGFNPQDMDDAEGEKEARVVMVVSLYDSSDGGLGFEDWTNLIHDLLCLRLQDLGMGDVLYHPSPGQARQVALKLAEQVPTAGQVQRIHPDVLCRMNWEEAVKEDGPVGRAGGSGLPALSSRGLRERLDLLRASRDSMQEVPRPQGPSPIPTVTVTNSNLWDGKVGRNRLNASLSGFTPMAEPGDSLCAIMWCVKSMDGTSTITGTAQA